MSLASTSTNGTAWPYQYSCPWPWTTANSKPASWATGHCNQGNTINVTTALENQSIVWLGGFIDGDYNGCGWVSGSFTSYVGPNPSPSACSYGTASRNETDFIYHTPDGTRYSWGTDTDGLPHWNAQPCAFYANYRPWSTVPRPKVAIRVLPANAVNPSTGLHRLRIRYMAKYPSADGTGYYVMARDTAAEAGWGNWGFVPASCL